MTNPLPDSLDALVRETVRLAELNTGDAAAVGQDLTDHFAEGLESGRTADELAVRFGDPVVAARLIAESRGTRASEGATQAKEKRMARFVDSLLADVRYAVRGLMRSPGFTVIAALTLALGIGVNTAIFSVVRATLLSSLPLADSHLLVRPYFRNVARGFNRTSVTYIDLTEWREQTDIFEAVAHYGRIGVDLEGDPPARTFGASVSEDFFKVYRAEPVLGRLFAPEEHVGDQTVVILARSFWESRFGADPDIPGTTIRLSGRSVTVVGVVDETTTWPTYPQFWIPRITPASMTNDMRRRDNFNRAAVARLRDDVSVEQASVRLGEMSARVARDNPVTREGWEADVAGLREWIVGLQLPVTLWVLLAAATFVLLIACTNVASLLATRSAGRKRQTAIRVAMGASPWQVARHLWAESLLIFVLGGGVGLAFASGGVNALLAIAPTNIPRITGAGIQMAEFAFALAMAVVAGLGFGMYPALKARKEDPSRVLREGTGSSESRGTGRFRRALVVVEVALSVILLVGAGLMIRSLGAMNSNDPGFRVDHLVTFGVTPPVSRYPDANDAHLFFDRVTDRFAALPGVQSASTTTWVPIGGGGIGLGRVHLADDMPEPPAGPDYSARWVMVGPDLFNTLAWPLQRGRAFTDADNAEGPQVAIINEVMADRMFPGESPIGKRVRSWRDENVYREIVGVVGNVRLDAVADDLQSLFLVPAKQVSWARSRSIVLRSAVDPTTLLPQLQGALSDVDPLVPVTNPRTGEILFDASVAASRFTTMLLSLFAVLAAVVAAIGLYGVIASTVTNRTKELGIRTALGSGRRRTMALVMGQGIRLAAVGAALGLVVSLLLTGAMTGMLFQVSARDPLTFAGITGGILLVALVAAYIPATRAMRVDPVRALREE